MNIKTSTISYISVILEGRNLRNCSVYVNVNAGNFHKHNLAHADMYRYNINCPTMTEY